VQGFVFKCLVAGTIFSPSADSKILYKKILIIYLRKLYEKQSKNQMKIKYLIFIYGN